MIKKLIQAYRKKTKKTTFTKKWVDRVMKFSCVWVTWSFVLATIGKENIAENLGIAVLTEIVAVCIAYFIKSVVETAKEEKMKYDRDSNNVHRSYKDNT